MLRDERSLPQMVLLSLFRVKFIIYPCQKRWTRETRARATHHPHTSSCHTPPSSQKFVHRSGTRRRFADTHREVPKPHLQVSGFRLETGSHPRGHQSFAQTGPAVDLYSPVATLSSSRLPPREQQGTPRSLLRRSLPARVLDPFFFANRGPGARHDRTGDGERRG